MNICNYSGSQKFEITDLPVLNDFTFIGSYAMQSFCVGYFKCYSVLLPKHCLEMKLIHIHSSISALCQRRSPSTLHQCRCISHGHPCSLGMHAWVKKCWKLPEKTSVADFSYNDFLHVHVGSCSVFITYRLCVTADTKESAAPGVLFPHCCLHCC